MPVVTDIQEYKQEGFAIVEDTAGKFVVTKHSPEMIPLPEFAKEPPVFPQRNKLCALVQSRERMLM